MMLPRRTILTHDRCHTDHYLRATSVMAPEQDYDAIGGQVCTRNTSTVRQTRAYAIKQRLAKPKAYTGLNPSLSSIY